MPSESDWIEASDDDVMLSYAVTQMKMKVYKAYESKGVDLIVPTSIANVMGSVNRMHARYARTKAHNERNPAHKEKPFKHTRAEKLAERDVAQWLSDSWQTLFDHPLKVIEWRDDAPPKIEIAKG